MSENEKLDLILSKISDITEETHELRSDVRVLKNDVKGLKEDVKGLKEDVKGLKEDVEDLKKETKDLRTDVEDLKKETKDLNRRMSSVEMTLENETNRNIKIIAEGHLDLARKLDDALRVENEKEILLIRVNILENEIRKMKEQAVYN